MGVNFRPCSEGYFLSGRPQSVILFILYSFPYRPFMHFTFRLRSNLNNSRTCNLSPYTRLFLQKVLKVLFSLQMQNIQSTNYTPLCVQCLNWNGCMQTRVSNQSSVNELHTVFKAIYTLAAVSKSGQLFKFSLH